MREARENPTAESYSVQLGERGRLVLPGPVRKRLSLQPGEELILRIDESGEIRLLSRRQIVESCKGIFKHLAPPDRLLSEELITERRQEALREDLE